MIPFRLALYFGLTLAVACGGSSGSTGDDGDGSTKTPDGVKIAGWTDEGRRMSDYYYTKNVAPDGTEPIVVYLAGTASRARFYKTSAQWIAHNDGRPVLILEYDNALNANLCIGLPGANPPADVPAHCAGVPACTNAVYRDKFDFSGSFDGTTPGSCMRELDYLPNFSFTYEDTIEARIVRFLKALEEGDWPEAGAYYNAATDKPHYDKVYLGGHSQGGTIPQLMGRYIAFAGAFSVGTPDDGALLNFKPGLTPTRRALSHEEDIVCVGAPFVDEAGGGGGSDDPWLDKETGFDGSCDLITTQGVEVKTDVYNRCYLVMEECLDAGAAVDVAECAASATCGGANQFRTAVNNTCNTDLDTHNKVAIDSCIKNMTADEKTLHAQVLRRLVDLQTTLAED
ncbi:MAG: hypothetical protein ACI9MC_003231 [Kiritimatiellia bacterium]|jgi:hypothetical protein